MTRYVPYIIFLVAHMQNRLILFSYPVLSRITRLSAYRMKQELTFLHKNAAYYFSQWRIFDLILFNWLLTEKISNQITKLMGNLRTRGNVFLVYLILYWIWLWTVREATPLAHLLHRKTTQPENRCLKPKDLPALLLLLMDFLSSVRQTDKWRKSQHLLRKFEEFI